jgi:shikimate kinase
MNSIANIFLVGMMGAGKTTIGRSLARHLGKTFRDTDHEIEARTGVRVAVIFEIEGEAGFRRREAEMVAMLAALDDLVLATGGGVILDPRNRELLRSRGCVVYLHAPPQELWQRTRHDKNRPLLRTEDPRARIEELYAIRDPLYRQTADVVVDTGSQSVNTLVKDLLGSLEAVCKLSA